MEETYDEQTRNDRLEYERRLSQFEEKRVTEVEVSRYDDLDYTMGVYMILDSKCNPVTERWGSHKLLYIGKVYDHTFLERFRQHLAGDDVWSWIQKNLKNDAAAKVGHVDLVSGERISFELVGDIESLLINVLKPPANIQSRAGYHGRDLTILNEGKYQPLPERVSTKDIE